MTGETLVGIPDPDDHRTPEQKHADHLTDILRDKAIEDRRAQEFHAAVAAGISAVDLAQMLDPGIPGEDEADQ